MLKGHNIRTVRRWLLEEIAFRIPTLVPGWLADRRPNLPLGLPDCSGIHRISMNDTLPKSRGPGLKWTHYRSTSKAEPPLARAVPDAPLALTPSL